MKRRKGVGEGGREGGRKTKVRERFEIEPEVHPRKVTALYKSDCCSNGSLPTRQRYIIPSEITATRYSTSLTLDTSKLQRSCDVAKVQSSAFSEQTYTHYPCQHVELALGSGKWKKGATDVNVHAEHLKLIELPPQTDGNHSFLTVGTAKTFYY